MKVTIRLWGLLICLVLCFVQLPFGCRAVAADMPDVSGFIAYGPTHSVALRTDGTVFAAGCNDFGQLDVEGWTDIIAVGISGNTSIGLKSDGTVITTDPEITEATKDWKDVVSLFTGYSGIFGLKPDGTLYSLHVTEEQKQAIDGWTDIQTVAVGYNHIVGLKTDGTVLAVGQNDDGQCDVSDWTEIVAITAGYDNTIGITANGEAIAVGDNYCGKSDVQEWKNMVAVGCGQEFSLGLAADGTVHLAGEPGMYVPDTDHWENIIALAVGEAGAIGVTQRGTVVSDGWDYWGQTLVGTWRDVIVPTPPILSEDTLTQYPEDAEHWYALGQELEETDLAQAMLAYGKAGYYKDSHQKALELQTKFRKLLSFNDTNMISLSPQGEIRFASTMPHDFDFSQFTDLADFDASSDFCIGVKKDGTIVWTGEGISEDWASKLSAWTDIASVETDYDYIVAQKEDQSLVCIGEYINYAITEIGLTPDTVFVFDSASEVARKEGIRGYHKADVLFRDSFNGIDSLFEDFLRFEDVVRIEGVYGIRADGTIAHRNVCTYVDCPYEQMTNVVDIAVTPLFTLLLKSDGTVIAVGDDDPEEPPEFDIYGFVKSDVQQWQDIVAIAAGSEFAVGLKADGQVVYAGLQYEGFYEEITSWNLHDALMQVE